MIYPYSSPNLRIIDLIAVAFLSRRTAENEIIRYFSELTGKKFILITNSCRTALYLAYKAIGVNGEVITSPLTCKVAIDPVIEAGNKPVFADIRLQDLNIDAVDIQHRITKNTIAIQAIHLGGVPCDMGKIREIAAENKLWLIEDCAQSLGSIYNNRNSGSFGDISCFSLIKNGYGIGGGILATDSQAIYSAVKEMNQAFTRTPGKLVLYRIIRNVIDTKRLNPFGNFLFQLLMKIKAGKTQYENVKNQLYQASGVERRIAAHQIKRYPALHHKRKKTGVEYFNRLNQAGIMKNNGFSSEFSSFTKFYVYNPHFKSKEDLEYLHDLNIEAMHLEHKHGGQCQAQLVPTPQAVNEGLLNYLKVHDSLISPPLSESFNKKQVTFLLNKFQLLLNK